MESVMRQDTKLGKPAESVSAKCAGADEDMEREVDGGDVISEEGAVTRLLSCCDEDRLIDRAAGMQSVDGMY